MLIWHEWVFNSNLFWGKSYFTLNHTSEIWCFKCSSVSTNCFLLLNLPGLDLCIWFICLFPELTTMNLHVYYLSRYLITALQAGVGFVLILSSLDIYIKKLIVKQITLPGHQDSWDTVSWIEIAGLAKQGKCSQMYFCCPYFIPPI